MTKYRFRLTGVPPYQAIKVIEKHVQKEDKLNPIMTGYRFRIPGAPLDEIIVIDLDDEKTVEEIKKIVLLRSKLNPMLYVSLICKGKILPDNLKLSELDIDPKKDVLFLMAHQTVGSY